MLFTCRYSELTPTATQVPVRTSRGFPRFRLKYDLKAYNPLVTPGAFFKEPAETYVPKYLDQLEAHGVDKIQRSFVTLTEQYGLPDLVLLCFEDLGNPTNWCHRRLFANWWLENTGEEVAELGRLYTPPAEPDPDLFAALEEGS